MMTKKHFIRLSKSLRALIPPITSDPEVHTQWVAVVWACIDLCAESNPAFNRTRFITACIGDQPHPHLRHLLGIDRQGRPLPGDP
jgi:hypothetical protein